MRTAEQQIVAQGYLPVTDGIYPCVLDDKSKRGKQWRNRALAIGVNQLIPPPADDGRFDFQDIAGLIESFADDPNPNHNFPHTVQGTYFFTEFDLRYISTLKDSDPAPGSEDEPNLDLRTVDNVHYRVNGLIAWQKFLVRHYTNLYRVVQWRWNPGRLLSHPLEDSWTMYTLPGSWQRVNRRLRDDADLKAQVEGNGGVVEAAAKMDEILVAWRRQQGMAEPYPTSTSEGNRFPCPKRWWIGHLETRVRVDSDHATADLPENTPYRGAFAVAATRFRQCVGTAMGYVDQTEETNPYP